LDKDPAKFRLDPAPEGFKLLDTKPIVTFGNAQIAFVILVAVGFAEEFYGMRHQAFIPRGRRTGARFVSPEMGARRGFSFHAR
jgi:hypothetical protein